MSTCDFTLAEYRRYLSLAVAEGYSFVSFESLDDDHQPTGPEILLRHDVDYAPKFLPPMAAIEAELGVRATYCVHVDCPWYSVETPENRAAITETLDAGHWLGLHFDASSIESDDDARKGVIEDAARLGEVFSRTVHTVSFHMPGRRPVDHLELPGELINTYVPRFFAEIGYVSDSNHNWRGVDLEAVLTRRAHDRLQLLIHPFWWRPLPATMRSKMYELATELGVDPYEIVTPEQWALMEEQERPAASEAADPL
ncbi:MAG TPA: hypothetical protein VHW96_09740 [Solirubrobacteraceae bacterium]|jgi:hypothetical protein|nr:hypothetical protein [Solirubrobacteraceae bacterium]